VAAANVVVGTLAAGYGLYGLYAAAGDRRPPAERPAAAQLAKWRGAAWVMLGVAVLVSGWSHVLAGVLGLAAVALFVTLTVIAVRRRRASPH
jgi:tetrahydromethanopterin S-methyltransferase subunit D